ncbi:MAG: single-stranded DNA-binding protein [Candidatus Eremiobacterota bacterium]
MQSYNKIILVGRLTRDPEIKYVMGGIPVSNYVLAVKRPYKNSEGTWDTDFLRIACWRKLAEFSKKYLTKGQLILVEGAVQEDRTEKDGQIRYFTNIKADRIAFMTPKEDVSTFAPASVNEEFVKAYDTGDLNLEEIPF